MKPQGILFVNKGVYDRVSQDFSRSTLLAIDDEVALRIYMPSHPTVQIHQSLASWIYHPSARPKGGVRKPMVKALIQAASGLI